MGYSRIEGLGPRDLQEAAFPGSHGVRLETRHDGPQQPDVSSRDKISQPLSLWVSLLLEKAKPGIAL